LNRANGSYAHGFLIEQDREVAEKSSRPQAKITSITPLGREEKPRDAAWRVGDAAWVAHAAARGRDRTIARLSEAPRTSVPMLEGTITHATRERGYKSRP
jgi:hypothetical protein